MADDDNSINDEEFESEQLSKFFQLSEQFAQAEGQLTRILGEIFVTEQKYCDTGLGMLLVYLEGMRKKSGEVEEPIIDEAIEVFTWLHNVTSKLLQSLKKQRGDRESFDNVEADLPFFLAQTERLITDPEYQEKVQKANILRSQLESFGFQLDKEEATKLFSESSQAQAKFEELFPDRKNRAAIRRKIETQMEPVSFQSAIIQPMQRATKFPLFFKEIQKQGKMFYGNEDHPVVQDAIDIDDNIKKLMEKLNENERAYGDNKIALNKEIKNLNISELTQEVSEKIGDKTGKEKVDTEDFLEQVEAREGTKGKTKRVFSTDRQTVPACMQTLNDQLADANNAKELELIIKKKQALVGLMLQSGRIRQRDMREILKAESPETLKKFGNQLDNLSRLQEMMIIIGTDARHRGATQMLEEQKYDWALYERVCSILKIEKPVLAAAAEVAEQAAPDEAVPAASENDAAASMDVDSDLDDMASPDVVADDPDPETLDVSPVYASPSEHDDDSALMEDLRELTEDLAAGPNEYEDLWRQKMANKGKPQPCFDLAEFLVKRANQEREAGNYRGAIASLEEAEQNFRQCLGNAGAEFKGDYDIAAVYAENNFDTENMFASLEKSAAVAEMTPEQRQEVAAAAKAQAEAAVAASVAAVASAEAAHAQIAEKNRADTAEAERRIVEAEQLFNTEDYEGAFEKFKSIFTDLECYSLHSENKENRALYEKIKLALAKQKHVDGKEKGFQKYLKLAYMSRPNTKVADENYIATKEAEIKANVAAEKAAEKAEAEQQDEAEAEKPGPGWIRIKPPTTDRRLGEVIGSGREASKDESGPLEEEFQELLEDLRDTRVKREASAGSDVSDKSVIGTAEQTPSVPPSPSSPPSPRASVSLPPDEERAEPSKPQPWYIRLLRVVTKFFRRIGVALGIVESKRDKSVPARKGQSGVALPKVGYELELEKDHRHISEKDGVIVYDTLDVPDDDLDAPAVPELSEFTEDYSRLTVGDTELGKGHFGAVTDGHLDGKRVAIKSVAGDPATLDREARMAKLASDSGSDYVVKFIGAGIMQGYKSVMVSELVENAKGPTELQAFLIKSRFKQEGPKDLAGKYNQLVSDLAQGVYACHSQNLIHRDIAARNCLLRQDENETLRAKVSDFGRALQLEEGASLVSDSNTGNWPIRWMAPFEMKTRQSSKASDLWSLAATITEITTQGRPPYPDIKDPKIAGTKLLKREILPSLADASYPELRAVQELLYMTSLCQAEKIYGPAFNSMKYLSDFIERNPGMLERVAVLVGMDADEPDAIFNYLGSAEDILPKVAILMADTVLEARLEAFPAANEQAASSNATPASSVDPQYGAIEASNGALSGAEAAPESPIAESPSRALTPDDDYGGLDSADEYGGLDPDDDYGDLKPAEEAKEDDYGAPITPETSGTLDAASPAAERPALQLATLTNAGIDANAITATEQGFSISTASNESVAIDKETGILTSHGKSDATIEQALTAFMAIHCKNLDEVRVGKAEPLGHDGEPLKLIVDTKDADFLSKIQAKAHDQFKLEVSEPLAKQRATAGKFKESMKQMARSTKPVAPKSKKSNTAALMKDLHKGEQDARQPSGKPGPKQGGTPS